jgi:hypothetical protein
MPYAHRTGGKRYRHDPANAGIFISGGSNVFPATTPDRYQDYHHREQEQRGANSFHITLPLRNRKGQEIPDSVPASISDQWHPFSTFNLALAYAKTMRVKHPILADCHIYACTDCLMESSSSGRFAVQLVSPSHIYRPNGLGPIRNQWPHYEALAA